MSIYNEMAGDLAQILDEFGKRVTFEGRELSALVSEPQETLELGAGGFTASGNFMVKLLRHDLAALPRIGQQVTYAGDIFSIVRVSNRPPHPVVTLTVEPA